MFWGVFFVNKMKFWRKAQHAVFIFSPVELVYFIKLCSVAAHICFQLKMLHIKCWERPITLPNASMELVNNECFCSN